MKGWMQKYETDTNSKCVSPFRIIHWPLVSWWQCYWRGLWWHWHCYVSAAVVGQREYVSPFLRVHKLGPSVRSKKMRWQLPVTRHEFLSVSRTSGKQTTMLAHVSQVPLLWHAFMNQGGCQLWYQMQAQEKGPYGLIIIIAFSSWAKCMSAECLANCTVNNHSLSWWLPLFKQRLELQGYHWFTMDVN